MEDITEGKKGVTELLTKKRCLRNWLQTSICLIWFIFINSKETSCSFEDTADLIIGADGAYSTLRFAMQHAASFQFTQEYIDHGYVELKIPSNQNDQMVANHLHIWPRKDFMMIALPNLDLTWTVTLFMPFKQFELLNDEKNILAFFESKFPDAVPLIGGDEIVNILLKKKPSSLIATKCNPHHVGNKFLLIGDSAHAIVPFYGQGMNITSYIYFYIHIYIC